MGRGRPISPIAYRLETFTVTVALLQASWLAGSLRKLSVPLPTEVPRELAATGELDVLAVTVNQDARQAGSLVATDADRAPTSVPVLLALSAVYATEVELPGASPALNVACRVTVPPPAELAAAPEPVPVVVQYAYAAPPVATTRASDAAVA